MNEDAALGTINELAAAAPPEWNLTDPRLELIKHRENAVYEVRSADGSRYALRVHRDDYHTNDELRSELQWMRALDEYGVRTPTIIPTADGELFKVIRTEDIPEGRQCDLLEWVDGAPLGSIKEQANTDHLDDSAATYRTIGKLMASLHNQSSEWLLPSDFKRHAWDVDGIAGNEPFWGRFWELAVLTAAQVDLVQAAAEIVRHRLTAFGKGQDRYGLIHADMLPENFLVDGSDVKLIDFDDSGFGWHMFDIATTMFFLRGEDEFDDVLTALIEGYRSRRELPDEHIDMLPTFLMARGLTYLGWLHTRRETAAAAELMSMVVASVCALAEDYCS